MNNQTKELKKLQTKWYAKLKKEGFDDIEQLDGNLKVWHSQFFKVRHNATLFQAKEDYYRAAGHFLHDHKFKDERERLIWTLHSDAVSVANIVKALKKKRYTAYADLVHGTIKELSQIMLDACRGSNAG